MPIPLVAAEARSTERRLRRREEAAQLAEPQHGVLSRRQLYAVGVTRHEVRAHLRAGRWRRTGRQTVLVHTGPLSPRAREWVAVLESGPRACLDGASALIAGGLTGFEVSSIRVSVPRGARIHRHPGVDLRQTRRWRAEDVVPSGVPRTRPEVAAVRAALWAKTDKQAALVLTMAVQQRLTSAELVGRAMLQVRRARRRAFVHEVILDLLGGVASLGELDVARECRARGIPEPTRQAVRRGTRGHYYLDLYWEEWGVVVEVDGIHHTWAQQVVGDALRQNEITLAGDVVLRLPLLGLRAAPDDFFAQIEAALLASERRRRITA